MKKSRTATTELVKVSDITLEGLADLYTSQIAKEDKQPVRGDFNLARLPYFALGDKKADRFRNLYLEIKAGEDEDEASAIWEVKHDTDLGLPGSFDRYVWTGILLKLSEVTNNGTLPFPEFIEIGSFSGFLKLIGKRSDGGKNIAVLRESIERLSVTTCVSKKSFNCPSAGGYLGQVFQLIDGWGFVGESDGNGGVYERNFVRLNSFVRKNLESGYITLIDVMLLQTLKTEIAKQLYQLLSYRFWQAGTKKRSYWTVTWQHLAKYLAVRSWPDAKTARRLLKPALLELKDKGYINDWKWDADKITFFAGDAYVKEHAARVQAWDSYQSRQKTIKPKQLESAAPPEVQLEPKSYYHLIPLASRWATGYDPSPQELLQRNCTLADLEAVVKAENMDTKRADKV